MTARVPETGAHARAEESVLMRTVIDSSTVYSMIATDSSGTIVMWNEGARRLYGYTASEIVGLPVARLHRPDDTTAELMMTEALEDGKSEGAVERVRKNGTVFTSRTVITPRYSKGGSLSGCLLIGRDITEEVRLALELEKSQAYTRAILESAPDAMVIVNAGGEIQLANAVTETLFGYARDELLGRHAEMLIPTRHRHRHPGDGAAFFSEPRGRAVDEGPVDEGPVDPGPVDPGLELTGRRKDGTEFPVQISLSPLQVEEGLATAAIRDVTERKRFEQDLRDVNLRLEEADQAKDRFLANMSHELRTPLNAILGFTGTLLLGLPGALNSDQTAQLRIVQSSGRHLLSLINDLLDMARIESGKVELQIEPVDLQELLDDVAQGLQPLADEKGLELAVVAPSERIEIRTDRRTVRQILINLANNAIKFTDDGGVRFLLSRHSEDGVVLTRVTVVDTGRGIKPEDQDNLFAAFERIEASTAQPYEGTGLGLYISLKLATMLRAAIRFDSEFGSGSSFTLEFSGSVL